MSNFIYYEKLEDYEEQVRKAKLCDEKDKEIERLNNILENIHEEIKHLYRKPKRMWYDDIQTLKTINEIVEKELKGDDK